MEPSQQLHFSDHPLPALTKMRAEDYLRLLHPEGAHGQVTLMRLDDDVKCARTYDCASLPFTASVWLDVSAYVTLHRFHGPRSYGRLAALNVLALDLDYRTMPCWRDAALSKVVEAFSAVVQSLGLPMPSTLTDTGRGFAALWFIDELHPAALERWQAAQACLIDLFQKFGADRACCDPARVFRIPETINNKNGREVAVLGGTLRRYGFDALADRIYIAAGRPTRAALADMTSVQKANKQKGSTGPRGLAPATRFRHVRGDLLTLVHYWKDQVPEGLRNVWLHVYATCLTHEHDVKDLESEVERVAAQYCIGLSRTEVASVIRAAIRRLKRDQQKYNYSGARIAEMLGVSDCLAKKLDLRQVFSSVERSKRRVESEAARRRAKGMKMRKDYLAANNISTEKPWLVHGYSRSTWYRKGCPPASVTERKTAEIKDVEPCRKSETSLLLRQGGLPRGTPLLKAAVGHQPLKHPPDSNPKHSMEHIPSIRQRADSARLRPNLLPISMLSAKVMATSPPERSPAGSCTRYVSELRAETEDPTIGRPFAKLHPARQ
ncbi:hypothetical protein SAMN04488040_0242 [Sulfitobacter marinus]|uniref:Uncharacterized protein n=1 Tax=Sulfitobacter marinus TaxID=394264 RepID=A0A1I6PMD2_9RHOB|nr:hypothetical protein [Sulfitobacter marinus]SFS41352.1 hypothetical protein SAMN04488040_0242 [Sulfitobacter marinus]